jgi:uncharacterized membrane protein
MNDTRTGDRLVTDHLRNGDLLLDHLPRPRRQEILDGLAEHIAAARAELADERDDDLQAILARVGTPEQIAAAEAEEFGEPARARAGAVEIVTLVGLLAGILMLPLFSLFIATGVMWFSKVWGRRDKLVVTALAAVGAAAVFGYFVLIVTSGEDGPSSALGAIALGVSLILWLASIVVSPILAAWLLGRHIWPLRRRPATVGFDAGPAEQGPQGAQPRLWPMVPPPAVDEAAVRRRRVRNWLYVVTAVVLIGSVVALVVGINGLVGGFFPSNGAARVSAPGTVTVTLDEAGDYLIAHEYEPTGPPDELGFSDPESGSPTVRSLRGEDGRLIPVRSVVDGMRYGGGHREGKAIGAFTITAPGRYELTSAYADGSDGPPTTLVVGRDTGGPWFAIILAGLGVVGIVGALVLLAVALVVHLTAPAPVPWNASSTSGGGSRPPWT